MGSDVSKKADVWPDTVILDNPIAHHFPVRFVEEVPLVLNAGTVGTIGKELELFRFTANEWISDALLFRGIEIKPRKPNCRGLLDCNLHLYIEDGEVMHRCPMAMFMQDGGAAFPARLPNRNGYMVLANAFRGWSEHPKEKGFGDMERFLGYFLPNKSIVIATIEGASEGWIEAKIKCDMARYTTKRDHQSTHW